MGEAPSGIGGLSSLTMRNRAGIGSKKWYGGLPSRSSITVQPTLLYAMLDTWCVEQEGMLTKCLRRLLLQIAQSPPAPLETRQSTRGIFNVHSDSLQYGLPTTASSRTAPAAVLLATPKSANFTHPSLFVKMFAPLMSRWMTPWSCK